MEWGPSGMEWGHNEWNRSTLLTNLACAQDTTSYPSSNEPTQTLGLCLWCGILVWITSALSLIVVYNISAITTCNHYTITV